jgi:outer membrane protein assembly factor BamB
MRKAASVFMVAVLAAALVAASTACRAARPNLAPRPEALGFPMMEAGALPFEGRANGPVRVRFGEAYFTTEEGLVYAIDVLSRRVLWKFKADAPVPAAPELGDHWLIIRDQGNAIYALDPDGRLAFRTVTADPVTSAVRELGGRILFGCGSGRIRALDPQNGRPVWEVDAGAPVCSGPVFSGRLAVFGLEDGRLVALDESGRPAWIFAARGTIRVDPAAVDGGLYFGTSERYFYGLAAATGKERWKFRLAGAPLHPAAATGRRLVFAASDSVVYCLSARSGEILWWQGVPARVVHAPSIADGRVLASALSPEVRAYDLLSGRPAGVYHAQHEPMAGAQWVTPYLILIELDPASVRERFVFLERDRRPVQTLGETGPIRR